jgi:hypothetical protein
LLHKVRYPLGAVGWGWGDTEFRLRVREAGLQEFWNRSDPVWHMFHPWKNWATRGEESAKTMAQWNRKLYCPADNSEWVAPPESIQLRDQQLRARFCCLS